MNVGEAVSAYISHRYPIPEPASPISTHRGRIARMNALEAQHGGAKGASQAVGVSRETWRRWRLTGTDPRTGKPRQQPSAANLGRLAAAIRPVYERRRDNALRRNLGAVRNIRITGIVVWAGYRNKLNGGQRTTTLDGPANLRSCIAPYLTRDLAILGIEFEQAIGIAQDNDPQLIQLEGDAVEASWN